MLWVQVKVFRIVSMVLFIAYPSVSVKILRLFNCREVNGLYWLTVDLRLQCFTKEWLGYASFSAPCAPQRNVWICCGDWRLVAHVFVSIACLSTVAAMPCTVWP